MIPFVSGNLSVEYLMKSVGGGAVPAAGSNRGEIDELARLGFGAAEDYVGWGAVEKSEGSFDWSFHRANLDHCRKLALQYVVYPWLHAVPEWFRTSGRFVGFRCLEHDRELGWPSFFDPQFPALVRRFYGELARALGDGIDALCVALPADYGEAGYPTGFGAWVTQPKAPLDHWHDGFWCGDRHARVRLRAFALARHGSLDALNRRWGTSFARPDEVTHPTAASALEWRRDFGDFYVEALAQACELLLLEARAVFPGIPLWLKVGHGGEPLHYGIDPTLLAAVAARHGAGLRSTQATLPALHQKRLASPCRIFQVPFASEPPVDVGREKIVERLFNDATSGTREYFDYAEHMVGARDLVARYGGILDGEASECDVALHFAAADLRLHPERGFPPVLLDVAEAIRARVDYELFDERALQAGALARCRVLALLEGSHLGAGAQAAILDFVAGGGALVVSPEFGAEGGSGPLFQLLARAPAADDCVELGEAPAPTMVARLGEAGDALRLAGDWYPRETAAQFRGREPEGEFSRWSGARGTLLFPLRAGAGYLLEIDGWVHPDSVHLRHEIVVNGVPVGRMARPGLQRFAAWLPRAAIEGRAVAEVAIESETFRPVDLGKGADPRALGVAVIWVRLTEEGSEAAGIVGGEARNAAPRLSGRVRPDELDARGTLAHGAGRVVVSRRAPLVAFLALLEDAVARGSQVVREAFDGAMTRGALAGLRATVFPKKLLFWNPGATDRELALAPSAEAAARLIVPAGGLLAVDRATRRPLPSARAERRP
jgi:hypothetical protein